MKLFYNIIIMLVLLASVHAQCSRSQTIKNEGGIVNCCYYDSRDIPTIGIGFNLQRSDARSTLSKYGLVLSSVLSTCGDSSQPSSNCLTDADAEAIFDVHYDEAEDCVDGWVGSIFPGEVYEAVVDMAFNLGCSGLKKFKDVKKGLDTGNYALAASGVEDSRYCGQVGSRCTRNVECIRSASFFVVN